MGIITLNGGSFHMQSRTVPPRQDTLYLAKRLTLEEEGKLSSDEYIPYCEVYVRKGTATFEYNRTVSYKP